MNPTRRCLSLLGLLALLPTPALAQGGDAQKALFEKVRAGRPRYADVRSITATVTWVNDHRLPREGKPPLPLQGLRFEMTFEPGDYPTVNMRLLNPPKGLSEEDTATAQYEAAGLILPAFEDPFRGASEFAGVAGAKTFVADGVLVYLRPNAADVIYNELRYRTAADATEVDEEKKNPELLTRKTLYRFQWQGVLCLYAGETAPEVEGVYRGIERAVSWQMVEGAPFPSSFKEISRDQSNEPKVTTSEIAVSDVRVTKRR